MNKVIVLLDYANINRAASDQGFHLDYGHLLDYLSHATDQQRLLLEAYAYVPLDPTNPYALDYLIETLWVQGYRVYTKTGVLRGDHYKCDFDVELCISAMSALIDSRPDVIVLVSGDGDFIPLALELRRRGIRVEVATFPISASRELVLKSSFCIDLETYYRDVYLTDFSASEEDEVISTELS